ncbi:MAG: rhodanese-like domain-containing protein [Phototrophicaceae bacterium]
MKFKRLIVLVALLSLVLAGAFPLLAQDALDTDELAPVLDTYLNETLPQGFAQIRPADLFTETLETELFLVDVRETSELEETGHIMGAVHVPIRTLASPEGLAQLPADLDTPIVVYCAVGVRGNIGMVALQLLGYTNVRNLAGGANAWIAEEYGTIEGLPEVYDGGGADLDPAIVETVDTYLSGLQDGFGQVRPDAVFTELLENPDIFLLDVREPEEWEADGYIEGAVQVPLRTLAASLDQLPEDKSTPIVVYCKVGTRGHLGMIMLQMLGYNARNMVGGIDGWITAGFDVVGGAPPAAESAEFELASYLDTYLNETLPQGFAQIRPEALFTETLETELFLVDVRETSELEETGHIMGAVHVPIRTLASPEGLAQLPADLDTPIVVYCAVGVRGNIGMVALQLLGYTNVRNLAGGANAWIAEEYGTIEGLPEVYDGGGADLDPAIVETVDTYLSGLQDGFGQVRPDAVFTELLENPDIFLLDVREPEEWEADGYIEGAVQVPLRTLAASLDQLPEDKSTPIVVYCKVGTRGHLGMIMLQMLGYNARNMVGGIDGWITSGYDVVGGAPAEVVEEAPEVELPEVELPEAEPLEVGEVEAFMGDTVVEVSLLPGFASITEQTLAGQLGNVYLVDVRGAEDYAAGHIPGAVNIPIRELARSLHLLPDTSTPVVVYCSIGHRSALGVMTLHLLGYENVNSLRGGFPAWTGQTETEANAPTQRAFPDVEGGLWATLDSYLQGLPDGFFTIRPGDLSTMMMEENTPYIIDVREPNEYAAGHIAAAVNMPMRSFSQYLGQLPSKDTPIVVYDHIGHRGALTMIALQLMGFEDVRSLYRGSDGWVADGYALVTD